MVRANWTMLCSFSFIFNRGRSFNTPLIFLNDVICVGSSALCRVSHGSVCLCVGHNDKIRSVWLNTGTNVCTYVISLLKVVII